MNNKERFLKYLQTCVKSTRSTESNPLLLGGNAPKDYVRFLESDRLFDYNPNKWAHIGSIYDINDYEKALEVFNDLIVDEDFLKRDKDDNQGWRRGAISHYVCFLRAQEFFSTPKENNPTYSSKNLFSLPLQQIFYGAPGTGKSHTINKETQGKSVIRTTFHPDSDYSTFVGSYKPTTKEVVMRDAAGHEIVENGKEVTEDRIVYEFVTQAFLQAYIEAWKKLAIGSLTIGNGNYIICGMKSDIVLWRSANSNTTDNQTANKETIRKHFDGEITEDTKNNAQSVIASYLKRLDQDFESAWTKLKNELSTTSPQYLIIEEINRGNCAQIFGDLFQLLDRNDYGFSDYPINADKDMKKQLAKAFNGLSINNADSINRLYNGRDVVKEVLSGDILLLPNNLYIWATMNTSDQSLFPIDSAFKRRWDWKYVPIDTAKENWVIKVNGKEYSWTSFLNIINEKIYAKTQSEDKQLGFYFCKAEGNVISAERFVSKVLFYVYNDVFKDYGFDDSFFNSDNGKLTFQGYYKTDGKINEEKVALFLDNLEVDRINNATSDLDIEMDTEGAGKAEHKETLVAVTINGERLTAEGSTQFDLYLNAIKKIGADIVGPTIETMKYRRKGSPMATKTQVQSLLDSDGYSYVELDGYYFVKGANGYTLTRILEDLNELLNLKIQIEYR